MSNYVMVNGEPRRDDELCHYGVLGMKWGIRRARRKEAKKQYRRATDRAFSEYEKSIAEIEKPYKRGQKFSDKDYSREVAADNKFRAANAKAKADYKRAKKDRSRDVEIANRLYSKQNKKANKVVAEMSTGMAFVESSLLGSYGALKYNEARAKGVSTGKAAVIGVLHFHGNLYTGGLLSATQYIDNRAARK